MSIYAHIVLEKWHHEWYHQNGTDTTFQFSRTMAKQLSKILRLNLKREYFEQIRDGTKPKEFRLASKWEPKLAGRDFEEIHLFLGYPKAGDESRVLRRKWNGYQKETITHPHFDNVPVEVLAIDVTKGI